MFSSFIPFLPVLFVFHRKDLVLLNLISKYMISTSESFLKSKDIVNLFKLNIYISKSFMQCNTGSCCVCITGSVNIYLYVCISFLIPVCLVWVCVCVCMISNRSTRKSHSRFDAFLHKTYSKVLLVLRCKGSTSLGP